MTEVTSRLYSPPLHKNTSPPTQKETHITTSRADCILEQLLFRYVLWFDAVQAHQQLRYKSMMLNEVRNVTVGYGKI